MLQKHKQHENNEFIPIEQTFSLNDDAINNLRSRNSIIPTNFKGKQCVTSFKLEYNFSHWMHNFCVFLYIESAEGVKIC